MSFKLFNAKQLICDNFSGFNYSAKFRNLNRVSNISVNVNQSCWEQLDVSILIHPSP